MWIVPVLFWVFCTFCLIKNGLDWRKAFLCAAVLWGVVLVAITEILSSFGIFEIFWVGSLWTLCLFLCFVAVFISRHKRIEYSSKPLAAHEYTILFFITFICCLTFVIAIIAPPNTWDSMAYHMPRVMHWLQNKSVAHYPTHILRQVDMNPWAEFAISHFQVLSGNDRFANLIQWFSMVGSLIGVSLIARFFGANRSTQIFSALIAATIPMGILQSSSTQNDYVVSFWLICFSWSMLEYIKKRNYIWAVFVGFSLGLAILTKGTAYIFAFPFCVWLFILLLGNFKKVAIVHVALIVFSFILINAPHYKRNYDVFSNPLSSGEYIHNNEIYSLSVFVSNFLRNSSLQLKTPYENINNFIEKFVIKIHKVIKIDQNDQRTSWEGTRYGVGKLTLHEDTTGNFLHSILFFVAFILFFLAFLKKEKTDNLFIFYFLCLVSGYFIYCFVMKWQPWIARLFLPLYVLGSPAAAYIIDKFLKKETMIIVAFIFICFSMPWVVGNKSRPLMIYQKKEGFIYPLANLPRSILYFANRPELYDSYLMTSRDIVKKGVTKIGLITHENSWEYPLWVLLDEASQKYFSIHHVDVQNATQRFDSGMINDVEYIVRMGP